MAYRSHEPQTVEHLMGLWDRGDAEECPIDHFRDAENLQFTAKGVITRDGIGIHQDVAVPLGNIKRIYNFVTQDANTLLVLTENTTTGDYEIYHVVNGLTVLGPILTVAGMTDFAFAPYAGRAYLSPFTSFGKIEKGLQNEFVYVYKGDGTAARKAAGLPPTSGALTINTGTGNSDAGFHLYGVSYETDTGYVTAPERFTGFTNVAANGISFSAIPVSPDSHVIARRLVATRAITNYNGDTAGYTYYFIPDGRIADNVTTVLNDITLFDADLLEEVTNFIDNRDEIPAGATLGIYNNRLLVGATYNDISLVLVSAEGEPEAMNEIDGFIIAPLDGNPVTMARELRDVLYVFKRNRTIAYVDNGEAPTSWPMTVVDYGLGCPVHGVADVIDSGSASIDYLVVATYRGICIFNGKYLDPELSWKISGFWLRQDKNEFRRIQILNDTVNKIIYCALPDRRLLYAEYTEGFDPKKIRWLPWRYDIQVNTIALVNTDDLIIGAERRLVA